MHIITAVEGFPEGINDFVRRMHKRKYKKGVAIIRPITLFNIQCSKEDREQVLKDLHHTSFDEHTYKDKKAFSFKHKESPFKHGKFRLLPYIFFKLFGWIIGIKPSKPVSENTKVENPLNTQMTNFYVLAEIDDNAWLVNARKGKKDDKIEFEYL